VFHLFLKPATLFFPFFKNHPNCLLHSILIVQPYSPIFFQNIEYNQFNINDILPKKPFQVITLSLTLSGKSSLSLIPTSPTMVECLSAMDSGEALVVIAWGDRSRGG
jgi:hypothetical protein